MTLEVPFQPLPADQSDVRYAYGPDSERQPRVPSGEIIEFEWNDSAIYPGTSRKFWVYVPAFTAAWLRPDKFRHVIGFLSSFTQMPGGNPYPRLIPSAPPKPLRIFLQAGHRDLHWNEPESNWLSNNLRVAAALAEAGYDFRLVLGEGGHSPNHGGVLLPDALRWLSRTDKG
jgi:hypothetical protein